VKAGTLGGTCPAVLNAANEVAVEAFLAGRIGFTGIWRTVAQVMDEIPHRPHPDLAGILTADADARQLAKSLTD
jgi:1-deoxy-D-xylulose-5-phosphate reductoisomerase